MATFFTMPKLGLNMVEGHIVNWLVKEGARVKAGEVILEIETDKATNEVEAPVDGIVGKILHQEGEDVPCNGVLAVLLTDGEKLPELFPSVIGEDVAPKSEVQLIEKEDEKKDEGINTDTSTKRGRIVISPSAKKLAQELGVDISKVVPSGNQIRREDVEKAYQILRAHGKTALPTQLATQTVELTQKPYTGIRKLTGEHMALSVHTTARVALSLEVDAEKLVAERKSLESGHGKVSYNVLIAKKVAQALKEFPYMNSRLVGNEIWEYSHSNVGIAVNTERGLLVPVLKDADKKTIEKLHNEFTSLAERAQEGKSNSQDLEGGTFTITNLGAQEIESFVPVINLPECAILAVGAIMAKAVIKNDTPVARQMMNLTLVFDHRLVDGYEAAQFLQRVKHSLED